ncbi:MAG: Mth938-like domain-containing protein [Hyphomicrobium sp.]
MTIPHFPERAPIEAYGNGGFRFAGMSHRGSILCLPSGIWGWAARIPADVTPMALDRVLVPVLSERPAIAFLLIGFGRDIAAPSSELRAAFTAAGIGLEPMSTGAAARTYNVLLAEGRAVAAALLAVD